MNPLRNSVPSLGVVVAMLHDQTSPCQQPGLQYQRVQYLITTGVPLSSLALLPSLSSIASLGIRGNLRLPTACVPGSVPVG